MAWQNSGDTSFEERLLWVFVLRRTVFDFVLYRDNARQAPRWKLAQQFLFEDIRIEEDGLTFDEICALFGWEPGYLRRLVLKMTRTDIKKLESTRFRHLFDCDQDEVLERTGSWRTNGTMTPLLPQPFYAGYVRQLLRLQPVTGHVTRASVFVPVGVCFRGGSVQRAGSPGGAVEARPS